MEKKGVELSMNVIIIAAIGLLVLVILAVLVINAANKVPTAQQSCNLQGGVCRSTGCGPSETPDSAACPSTADTCCKIFTATG